MKKTWVLFLFILAFPVFADDFTLDEWLSLYKEGFFGEVEELPAERPLYTMNTLGLRFVMEEEEEKTETAESETIFIEEESPLKKEDILSLPLIKKEEEPVLNLRIISKEEEESKSEDTPIQLEEETPLAEESLKDEVFFDDAFFLFEGPPLVFEVPAFETRTFNDIFPNFTPRQRSSALGRFGLRYYFTKDESPRINPNPDSGIDLLGSVMSRDPSHIIEAITVVPYREKEFDLLDIYNALGRIENIKDYPIRFTNGDYYVITESTRVASNRNRRAIPDPLPADKLPFAETIYLRLKEATIGNVFLRGDVSFSVYGITYNMTNFVDVRYFLVPVMKAERFSTILYLEPIKEGVLVYCVVGFYLPDFVADRVNLTPNINRRIDVFVAWITDGLRQQESQVAGSSEQ